MLVFATRSVSVGAALAERRDDLRGVAGRAPRAPAGRPRAARRRSRVAASDGAKYLATWLPSAPRPAYQSPKPWMTSCRPLRVFGSSVLKSWSRSTIVVVLSRRDDRVVLQLGVAVGARARARCSGWRRPDSDVARMTAVVPGVQRRVGLLDGDRDLRLVVVGQLDLLDRADRAGRRSARRCR